MIPLRALNPVRGTPVVTYALIAACFAVFAYELILQSGRGGGATLQAFFLRWGAVPDQVSASLARGEWVSQGTLGLVSSQFLHGGWLHILGNILLGYFITTVNVPAVITLGLWFVLQLITGVASIGASAQADSGVATFAHLGGFVMGMVVGLLLRAGPGRGGRVG